MAKETNAAKIKRLQHELDMCNSNMEALYNANQKLVEQAEQDFLNSPTYQQMRDRITFLESVVKLDEYHIQSLKADMQKIDDKTRQIYEDNRKLVENKDNTEYFIGITENYHDAEEYMELRHQILNEKGKVDGLKLSLSDRDNEIVRLQGNITELKKEKKAERINEHINEHRKKGRPFEVTDSDRQRIRKLREDGYSIRAIASQVGFSIGTVHKILNN